MLYLGKKSWAGGTGLLRGNGHDFSKHNRNNFGRKEHYNTGNTHSLNNRKSRRSKDVFFHGYTTRNFKFVNI